MSRIGNLARLIYTLLYVMTMHTLLQVLTIHILCGGFLASGSPLVISEQNGSHTGEVVLCWGLVEQARHEHRSDEYKNQYIIKVPSSPSLVKARDTTVVSSELNRRG